MLRTFFLAGAFLVSTYSFSQKKELTLKDAVSQQYRAFMPEQIPFFQWIPGTSDYSYLDGYITLMKGNTSGKKEKLLTIEQLNTALGAELNWFSGFEWVDGHTFNVTDGKNYYSYNLQTQKGTKTVALDDKADNAEMHLKSGKVAYTIDNNLYVIAKDQQPVAITSNSDKNIVSGQTYARSEFGIHGGIFWSNKGELLAFAQKDESEVHDYPLLDITKTPGEAIMIKYPMAGQKSEKPKIGIYSFSGKKSVFITPRSGADSYLTNVTFSADDQFLLIAEVNRDQNHMWMNKYNAATGEFIKTLFEESNDKWIEPEHPAYFHSTKNNDFIWISERDGFNNLYLYDIEGKLKKQLTNNRFVVKNILKSIKNGSEIVFSATGENPLNTMYYAVDLNGKQRLLTLSEGTHAIEVNDAATYLFDQYSSSTVPSRAILSDLKGKEIRTLLTGTNKLDGYAIGTTEIGTIKASDGTTLYTRLIKPSNFDPSKKYPVMVYVYGGPHAQLITNSWYSGANLWMNWMAEQGYLVFTVDNRGSAERGFAFESGIHRQLGKIEMEDQLTGVEHLKSLPYVDGNRLAVHGWSFGGFMTTSLMLRHPDTFKVGVAGGPVVDWKWYEAMYGERYMDTPEQNPEGYAENSLLNYADKLKGDLLLIHGTIDDVVVMQHNLALVKKFVDAGIQVDFFPYPMHKHNVTGKDRVHLIEKILNYILEKNK